MPSALVGVVILLALAAGVPSAVEGHKTAVSGLALPAPTGPYAVGRTVYHWTDPSRGETSAARAGEHREVQVWVWYPAAPAAGAEPGPYAPAGWEAIGEFWGFGGDGVRGQAFPDAPVAPDRARYPVLLFTANGFPPFNHAAILEEMASHGFVVVGVNNTYQTPVSVFPDGRAVPVAPEFLASFFGPFTDPVAEVLEHRATIVEVKVADLQSAVRRLERLEADAAAGTDPLAGRLDLSRVGAFGHSMGGNAALEWCRVDRRCVAAASLDGANWTEVGRVGLTQPALLIAADHPETGTLCVDSAAYPAALCEADRAVMAAGRRTLEATARPSYAVTIRGAVHAGFLDMPFLPLHPGGIMEAGLAAAAIDSERMWRVTCDYLLAFFARHLTGEPAPLLDGPSPDYPEVVFGSPAAVLPANRS